MKYLEFKVIHFYVQQQKQHQIELQGTVTFMQYLKTFLLKKAWKASCSTVSETHADSNFRADGAMQNIVFFWGGGVGGRRRKRLKDEVILWVSFGSLYFIIFLGGEENVLGHDCYRKGKLHHQTSKDSLLRTFLCSSTFVILPVSLLIFSTRSWAMSKYDCRCLHVRLKRNTQTAITSPARTSWKPCSVSLQCRIDFTVRTGFI